MKKFKSPLSIYVLWHPDFKQGKEYAKNIYNTYSGGNGNLTHAKFDIPVHYRTNSRNTDNFKEIPFSESEKNALILFVDDNMIDDNKWNAEIEKILKSKTSNTRVIPISFSKYAIHLSHKYLSSIQFIEKNRKPLDILNQVESNNEIKYRLLESIAKFLFNVKDNCDTNEHSSDPPIKLFISHAKHDGENLAIQFRNYVYSNTKLKAFFDTNDIADGHNFEQEIEKNINRSAFVILNTDNYANREWCRKEVIIAKRSRCSIISVMDIKKGEKRSFPYSGNCPTIVWNCNFKEIINLILSQVISDQYNDLYLESIVEMYELRNKCLKVPKAPELFDCVDIEKERKKMNGDSPIIVLYPEPPLGVEELNLLNDVDEKIEFVTPLLLPTFLPRIIYKTTQDLDISVADKIKDTPKRNRIHLLKDQGIGISISDSIEIEELGFSIDHQKKLITEITRFIIIHGGKLIYGGDLRRNGYTRIFSNIVHQHRPSKEVDQVFFKNYFSFPIYLKINRTCKLEFKINGVEPVEIEPPEYLDVDKSKFYEPKGKENLLIWAESLTKMRQEMQKDTKARIFAGGKLINFKGKYPGLLEESILALKDDIPVYFIGIFGGITYRIIEALKGKKPQELTIEWHTSQNENYKEFVEYYNSKNNENRVDYSLNAEFLNKYTLDRLSKNNGLTIDENERLFDTIHSAEIIFLIMKGLKAKLGNQYR